MLDGGQIHAGGQEWTNCKVENPLNLVYVYFQVSVPSPLFDWFTARFLLSVSGRQSHLCQIICNLSRVHKIPESNAVFCPLRRNCRSLRTCSQMSEIHIYRGGSM